MNALSLATEAGAQGGYTITGSTGQDPINKARAFRRVNMAKADITARYGAKWDANYQEGWLPLVPLYSTGTADFTINSRTVTGTNTAWTSTYTRAKILGPDGNYYKIASVISATSLVLTQPYQGATLLAQAYLIWKDEYRLYPKVHSIGGFVNYTTQNVLTESWPRNMKDSYAKSIAAATAEVYTVIGREKSTSSYAVGTVTGSINDTALVGVGTLWLDNIEPGYEITIGLYTYHVKRVNSDTSLELEQKLVVAVAASTYTSVGKNAIIVRFQAPSVQTVVNYWYWAKDYPFVNDNDEDWMAELYPKVILAGTLYFDYLDKNDFARASLAAQVFENAVKDMKVATDSAMTGVRTLGYDIPDEARD
jgi:hypothetical protein